jgi:hypothetical protein
LCKIKVLDKDTLSDDLLGEHGLNLNSLDLPAASGLKWTDAGSKPPASGIMLEHAKLAEALTEKTEFTPPEWEAFGIRHLRMDHYIKSGMGFVYYKPAAADVASADSVLTPFQMRLKTKETGCVYLAFSRAPPRGAFQGCLHVTVDRIADFAEQAGLMDKTDPYISLSLGGERLRTSTKNNAGGSVVFNETLTFADKPLLHGNLHVQVMDSDTLFDDTLGAHTINVHGLDMESEDFEDETPRPFDVLHKGAKAGTIWLAFSRRTPPGAFAGIFHVTVLWIDEFADTAGFRDRTDPYVSLSLGSETLKTSTQDNAGGSNVVFNETLTFHKPLLRGLLTVSVMDEDTLVHDTLGACVVDVHSLELAADYESAEPECYKVMRKGSQETAGCVYLRFCRRALPRGAFAGPLNVTVVSICDFGDGSMFDRLDPFVEIKLGAETLRTSTQENAGGSVVFDEVLGFSKAMLVGTLKVCVVCVCVCVCVCCVCA